MVEVNGKNIHMTGNVHKYTKCSQETYTHVQTIVGMCKGGDTWQFPPPPPIQDIVYSALILPSTSISGGSREGGGVCALQCITLVHIHRAIPHLQELRSYSLTDLSRAHYQYICTRRSLRALCRIFISANFACERGR